MSSLRTDSLKICLGAERWALFETVGRFSFVSVIIPLRNTVIQTLTVF